MPLRRRSWCTGFIAIFEAPQIETPAELPLVISRETKHTSAKKCKDSSIHHKNEKTSIGDRRKYICCALVTE